MGVHQLSPHDLSSFLHDHPDAVLLDVREPWEHQLASLRNSILIPLGQLPVRAEMELPEKDTPIVVYCHHGIRSLRAAAILAEQGYMELHNLTGGIDRYSREVDASVGTY